MFVELGVEQFDAVLGLGATVVDALERIFDVGELELEVAELILQRLAVAERGLAGGARFGFLFSQFLVFGGEVGAEVRGVAFALDRVLKPLIDGFELGFSVFGEGFSAFEGGGQLFLALEKGVLFGDEAVAELAQRSEFAGAAVDVGFGFFEFALEQRARTGEVGDLFVQRGIAFVGEGEFAVGGFEVDPELDHLLALLLGGEVGLIGFALEFLSAFFEQIVLFFGDPAFAHQVFDFGGGVFGAFGLFAQVLVLHQRAEELLLVLVAFGFDLGVIRGEGGGRGFGGGGRGGFLALLERLFGTGTLEQTAGVGDLFFAEFDPGGDDLLAPVGAGGLDIAETAQRFAERLQRFDLIAAVTGLFAFFKTDRALTPVIPG